MVGHSHKEKRLTEGAWWHVGGHDAGEVVRRSTPGSQATGREKDSGLGTDFLKPQSPPQ